MTLQRRKNILSDRNPSYCFERSALDKSVVSVNCCAITTLGSKAMLGILHSMLLFNSYNWNILLVTTNNKQQRFHNIAHFYYSAPYLTNNILFSSTNYHKLLCSKNQLCRNYEVLSCYLLFPHNDHVGGKRDTLRWSFKLQVKKNEA